jgi:hypothetical protein
MISSSRAVTVGNGTSTTSAMSVIGGMVPRKARMISVGVSPIRAASRSSGPATKPVAVG